MDRKAKSTQWGNKLDELPTYGCLTVRISPNGLIRLGPRSERVWFEGRAECWGFRFFHYGEAECWEV